MIPPLKNTTFKNYRVENTQDDPDYEYDPHDQGIVPIRYTPAMCTSVVLQPHTSAHLHVPDETPDEALSRGFENYTCLTQGQTMTLRLTNGEEVVVTVVEAHPQPTKEGAKPKPLCIRSTEVVLDLLPPLDAVQDVEKVWTPNVISPEVLARLTAEHTVSTACPQSEPPAPIPAPQIPEQEPPRTPVDREARRALLAAAALRRQTESAS